MADSYIDQDETQLYGPHASKHIRSHVVGLVAACDGALQHFADEIDAATTAVGEQIDAGRSASAGVRASAKDKRSPLTTASRLLSRFSAHLDTHEPPLDRRVFFTDDGTVSGVGKSGARVLLALTTVKRQLSSKSCPVDNKAKWLADFTAAALELQPALETAASAQTDRRSITPDVEAAREAWLVTYRSARDVATGVLRSAGRLDLLKAIFYDLAVPSGAKVAVIPPVPADPPEPPAEADDAK
ncbi:MAG TPA: hypothetical protein VGM56_07720 [Byssovorax sp.]|jgi:hypothetical protein